MAAMTVVADATRARFVLRWQLQYAELETTVWHAWLRQAGQATQLGG